MLNKYTVNVLVALDQLGNVLLGGYPDETISSRAGKAALQGRPFWANVINIMFFWQDNHCLDAIEWDEGRTLDKLEVIKHAKQD